MASNEGLKCATCGPVCSAPRLHLVTPDFQSELLHPDTPCLQYVETNKWGTRWRVMHIYAGAGTMRWSVDVMGDEDDYAIGPLEIPSVGRDVTLWNTVGECLEIAIEEHSENKNGWVRKRIPAATAAQWAQELVQQGEEVAAWRVGKSTFGPAGSTQRSTDWIP